MTTTKSTTQITFTTIEREPVTLGTTTYAVSETHHEWIDHMRNDEKCMNITVWLTGPRGAQYFLRPYIERNGDTGLRQVISWKSGQPLRVRGNEVRVYHLGDIITVAK